MVGFFFLKITAVFLRKKLEILMQKLGFHQRSSSQLKGSVHHTVQSGHHPHLVTRTILTLKTCETPGREQKQPIWVDPDGLL